MRKGEKYVAAISTYFAPAWSRLVKQPGSDLPGNELAAVVFIFIS